MTITALGLDGLEILLRGNGRVTVANGGPEAAGLVILAAAVVRHGSSGVASRQAILGLGLRSDEAKTIEPPEATDQLFDGVEVLLRIFTPGRLGMRDVYIASSPDAPPSRTMGGRSACRRWHNRRRRGHLARKPGSRRLFAGVGLAEAILPAAPPPPTLAAWAPVRSPHAGAEDTIGSGRMCQQKVNVCRGAAVRTRPLKAYPLWSSAS